MIDIKEYISYILNATQTADVIECLGSLAMNDNSYVYCCRDITKFKTSLDFLTKHLNSIDALAEREYFLISLLFLQLNPIELEESRNPLQGASKTKLHVLRTCYNHVKKWLNKKEITDTGKEILKTIVEDTIEDCIKNLVPSLDEKAIDESFTYFSNTDDSALTSPNN